MECLYEKCEIIIEILTSEIFLFLIHNVIITSAMDCSLDKTRENTLLGK